MCWCVSQHGFVYGYGALYGYTKSRLRAPTTCTRSNLLEGPTNPPTCMCACVATCPHTLSPADRSRRSVEGRGNLYDFIRICASSWQKSCVRDFSTYRGTPRRVTPGTTLFPVQKDDAKKNGSHLPKTSTFSATRRVCW